MTINFTVWENVMLAKQHINQILMRNIKSESKQTNTANCKPEVLLDHDTIAYDKTDCGR